MSNEEKILTMLTQMQGDITGMKGEIAGINDKITGMEDKITRMENKITGMENKITGMENKITGMENKITGMENKITRMEADISALKSGQAQTAEELHCVKAYLELDVEKRFDGINEGIDTILETLVPEVSEYRMAKAEDDIVALKTAVKILSSDVAELKKAQ